VPGDALVEAVFAEDAEGGGEAAFEVVAFGVFVGEGWGAGNAMVSRVVWKESWCDSPRKG
jgi:hypothetical protein